MALPPGSTIGILGGGQLARMLALAGGRLGLKAHIYAPEADSPAFEVSSAHTVARYDDKNTLAAFAASVDAVTYEFENVPSATVMFLESRVPVRPGSRALDVAQDRIKEKTLARKLGAATAEFAAVNSLQELQDAVLRIGIPSILKTTRMGYDGKGQAKLTSAHDVADAYAAMKGAPAILESFVDFECEISVIAARSVDGDFKAYDVAQNVHRHHILHTSTVPCSVPQSMQALAVMAAKSIMNELDYVGVMGLECFVGGGKIYFNEIAPRVHNSGHWTQDACVVSQFEQHMRAVAGWPLGDCARHSNVVMTNLIGDDVNRWKELALEPATAVHLYGKTVARPARKMGHFNRLTSL
jgi:5-(carboxyamino)imidazole ribonucleotide synthase